MRGLVVVVLLAAWMGAAILLAAVVAPAAFAALPSRTLAGDVVGRVLPVVFVAGAAVGTLAAVTAFGGGRFAGARVSAALVLVVSCLIAQLAVAPRIARVRAEIGAQPVDQLPPGDPRRATFGRLHALSVGWLALGMIAAVTAIAFGGAALRSGAPPR